MGRLWDEFLSLGASVSKEGRSGPVRTAYLRSELTPGDGNTKKSRLWLGETLDGFMSHVENSSSWGDGGSCGTGPRGLGERFGNRISGEHAREKQPRSICLKNGGVARFVMMSLWLSSRRDQGHDY